MHALFRLVVLLVVVLLPLASFRYTSVVSRVSSRYITLSSVPRRPVNTNQVQTFRGIDARSIREGSIVEYISAKGSKRLALVSRRVGAHVEVLNDAKKAFSVPLYRVICHINGTFAFGDLLRVVELVSEIKPVQVERLWELTYGQTTPITCNVSYISKHVYGTIDPVRMFASLRLMNSFGNVFFEEAPISPSTRWIEPANGGGLSSNTLGTAIAQLQYIPLTPSTVQDNLRNRAALKEFKQRYLRVMNTKNNQLSRRGAGAGPGPSSSYSPSTPPTTLMPDMPERILNVLDNYSDGLKQLVIKTHPWVMNGWARRRIDEKKVSKGREFLEFLELAPAAKNAKKLLEVIGTWPLHTNIEKYVMDLRDSFPPEVLDEAQYLLDNSDVIPDPDERLRRDLRHLGCYAIDSEGAAEVDDALSVEYLEDGREKLWIHIADVSRWIRPGSQLSLEAERRMTSIYMPDERISMFPYSLSSELLSLGAYVDSYALSCGVTLNAKGEVTSFEVCPSKVRVTRRLSYIQLDEILSRARVEFESGTRISSADTSTATVTATAAAAALLNPPFTPLKALEDGIQPESRAEEDGSEGEVGSSPLDEDLGVGIPKPGKAVITRTYMDSSMRYDLWRLNHWAVIRHKNRVSQNALDQYLRHKTELTLNVKRDPKSPLLQSQKFVVSGYTSWSNATSMSLVSEYMILMCQTIGVMCQTINAPVWYKTQEPSPPLSVSDLQLREGETPFLRAARLMRNLRAANDSRTPGIHCTSGSHAYVQCTSPIRRYHDLYNHYRLKAAMHGASLGEAWADRAKEEAGISRLDSMATAEERLQTLNAVRLVTRHREQYWLQIYMDKLIGATPRLVFDCLIYGFAGGDQKEEGEQDSGFPGSSSNSDSSNSNNSDSDSNNSDSSSSGSSSTSIHSNSDPSAGGRSSSVSADGSVSESSGESESSNSLPGKMYDALILQLGSFVRYKLYSPTVLVPGQLVKCHLYRRYINPRNYLLLPMDLPSEAVPEPLAAELVSKGRGRDDQDMYGDDDTDNEGD